jgi:protein-disulfide isomerase
MQNFKKIAAGLLTTFLFAGCAIGSGSIGEDAARKKAEAFINSDLLAGGVTASILEIKEDKGLYHITIELDEGGNKREVESYLSMDGKTLFPSAVEITTAEEKAEAAKADNSAILAAIPKSEKPVVELFVMSFCPFGTQAEKGLIPAIKALGEENVDFQLKFVDYAMHAEKELAEQIREVAIRNNSPESLIPYLEKFLEAGDSDAAIAAAGLDAATVAAWGEAIDSEYKVMESFADKATWKGNYPSFAVDADVVAAYGVEGSPALVINGKLVKGLTRDAATMLDAVCAGFSATPDACETELSTETPSSGFGYAAGENSSDGSCS